MKVVEGPLQELRGLGPRTTCQPRVWPVQGGLGPFRAQGFSVCVGSHQFQAQSSFRSNHFGFGRLKNDLQAQVRNKLGWHLKMKVLGPEGIQYIPFLSFRNDGQELRPGVKRSERSRASGFSFGKPYLKLPNPTFL